MLNSLIVASLPTVLVLVFGTLAAYSLARLRWRRWIAGALLGWTLIFNMVSPLTPIWPWYLTFHEIGLSGTLAPLILTHIALYLPMTIWLMMAYFNETPKEIEDAALVDGCRRIDAF